MGRVKKEKLEPLRDYEEDGIWMSYRYCIGRKSISSHARAGDILKYYYKRLKLTHDRCCFMAQDINKSIEDCLRWGQLNVYMSYSRFDTIYPLEEVFRAISNNEDIIDPEKLNNISKINIEVLDYGNVDYKISRDDNKNLHYPLSDLEDLMVWNNCAKILDLDAHKVCKVSYQDKDEYIEYVDIKTIERQEDDTYKVINRKVPVDRYISNIYLNSYINENYIIEDNLPLNILENND